MPNLIEFIAIDDSRGDDYAEVPVFIHPDHIVSIEPEMDEDEDTCILWLSTGKTYKVVLSLTELRKNEQELLSGKMIGKETKG